MYTCIRCLGLLVLLLLCGNDLIAASTTPIVPSEEFNGPFASWKNLKTDFGAVGDGKADDTAAIEAGKGDSPRHRRGHCHTKPGNPF